MQKLGLILGLYTVVLCSCGNDKKIDTVQGVDVKVDSSLSDAFFQSTEWDYDWFIIKGDNGKFESTLSDTVLPQDTTHIIHTAKCITNQGGDERTITKFDAILMGDTLYMDAYEASAAYSSSFRFRVSGSKILDSFFFRQYQGADKEHSTKWKVLDQTLVLNKPTYKIGDSIKGKLDVTVETTITEHKTKQVKKDTFFIKGPFRAVVQSETFMRI